MAASFNASLDCMTIGNLLYFWERFQLSGGASKQRTKARDQPAPFFLAHTGAEA